MAGFMEWFLSKLRLIDDDEIEIEEESSEDIIPWLVGKKKIKDVAYNRHIFCKKIMTYEDTKEVISKYKLGAECVVYYMNAKTLQLLSQKKQGVEVVLFTENGHGKKGFLTPAVVSDFSNQYPSLRIKSNSDCHDRLIVIDYGLPTEQAYHCGASSKDAGKKLCAINNIVNTEMIHPVIDKLLLGTDKVI